MCYREGGAVDGIVKGVLPKEVLSCRRFLPPKGLALKEGFSRRRYYPEEVLS